MTSPAGVQWTLEEMCKLAESRGGQCLSQEYGGNKSKLLWRCRAGHEWETRPDYVRRGHWCAACATKNQRRYSIEDMQQLAAEFGGRCLSKDYINYRTPLEWECGNGHRFEALFWRLRNGRWCTQCNDESDNAGEGLPGHPPYPTDRARQGWQSEAGLARANEVATSRGGKCLSTQYLAKDDFIHWECSQGHRWQSRLKNILAGTWCPACAVNRRIKAQRAILGIVKVDDTEELAAFAESLGLHLVQPGPVRVGRNDFFKCESKHMWELHRDHFSTVVWCPECGRRGEAMGKGRLVRG